MVKISKIKKLIALMLSVLFYFGQSYAQNVVSFSKLKERDNKLYLGDQVFSGFVFKTFITNQLKSISEVKEGSINGKVIEFVEDISFVSKAYRDTAEISRLNSQISFKSQELAQAIQDNDKAYKEQNDFLINEIGGIEKLQKLKEKDTEGKLNKKKKEIYDKYEQLFQTNKLCVRKSNDIQQQINNLNQQLKSENDKPNYIPKKALEYSILDGAKHGAAIIYDSNGNKIGEGSYLNGKQNGKWVYYFSNGQKLGEGSFINGDESNKGTSGVPKNGRDGIWIFYFENGKHKENSSWKNGVLDGPYKYYYGFGQLKEEGVIISDKVVGLVKQFYESGNKKALLNYSNGLQHGLQTKYHENGKLSEEISWKNGAQHGPYKIYYETGQLREEGGYNSDKVVGIVKNYYESGKLQSEANYRNSYIIGEYKSYYENGNIKEISSGTERCSGCVENIKKFNDDGTPWVSVWNHYLDKYTGIKEIVARQFGGGYGNIGICLKYSSEANLYAWCLISGITFYGGPGHRGGSHPGVCTWYLTINGKIQEEIMGYGNPFFLNENILEKLKTASELAVKLPKDPTYYVFKLNGLNESLDWLKIR